MTVTTSRRTVLGALGAVAVLRFASDSQLTGGVTFPEGVMAGVPRTDGATLWTRVPQADARLRLLVSKNEDLSSPAIAVVVVARTAVDGCVHFDATGLSAGEQYFSQFRGSDAVSPVGRFRTLRPADSAEPVRLGFFGCQDYAAGFYAAHRHLAAEDLDLVVCLGDYVYESPGIGAHGIDLNAYPQVLPQMREKYRFYRQDADLRAMHAAHAFLPLWDDHEFRNNYTKNKWTFPVEPLFQQKKRWAWQAWFERMPVPRPSVGDPTRHYRSLRLGRTVELFALDTRQYRDDQPCNDGSAIACADADNPQRTMLGAAQKTWLFEGLRTSGAQWKVLANPNMLMGMLVGSGGQRAFMDSWDGYGAERTELLSLVANRVSDLLVVTGDDHDTFAGELWNTGFAPGSPGSPGGTKRAGVEFLIPSLSSANTGDVRGADGAGAEEQNRLAHNPHLKLVEMKQHGYGVLSLNRDEAVLSYRRVSKLDPAAGVDTPFQFRVPRGTPTLDPLPG